MPRALWGLALLVLASCASAGSAEDYQWSVECPKAVDKGAEFSFTVRTMRPGGGDVPDVPYRFQITWTGGSAGALRHQGSSGTPSRLHARMVAGPASMVITCPNREGLDVKVAEAAFEVK